jgi:hypothetical protein
VDDDAVLTDDRSRRFLGTSTRLVIAAGAVDAVFAAACHRFLGVGVGVLAATTVLAALAIGMRVPVEA